MNLLSKVVAGESEFIFSLRRGERLEFSGGPAVRASVRPLTPISRDVISSCLAEILLQIRQKYAACERPLLETFSRSEVKGQGHTETRCT